MQHLGLNYRFSLGTALDYDGMKCKELCNANDNIGLLGNLEMQRVVYWNICNYRQFRFINVEWRAHNTSVSTNLENLHVQNISLSYPKNLHAENISLSYRKNLHAQNFQLSNYPKKKLREIPSFIASVTLDAVRKKINQTDFLLTGFPWLGLFFSDIRGKKNE